MTLFYVFLPFLVVFGELQRVPIFPSSFPRKLLKSQMEILEFVSCFSCKHPQLQICGRTKEVTEQMKLDFELSGHIGQFRG